MENQVNKSCENCKHFRGHYVMRGGTFYKTNYGHCADGNVTLNRKMQSEQIHSCRSWEFVEEVKVSEEKTVKALLQDIEKSLNAVINIMTYKK